MAQESWKRDKEETGCQPPEGPVLCTNNCGFFGSAATTGLCSKCYRDFVLKQAKASSAKAAAEKAVGASSQNDFPLERADLAERQMQPEGLVAVAQSPGEQTDGGSSSSDAPPSASELEQPRQQTPNRCFSCKKRIGLTGFKCRCGNSYCALHRYSDKHNCSFDYKTAGRDAIAKANPVVKADKIDKI